VGSVQTSGLGVGGHFKIFLFSFFGGAGGTSQTVELAPKGAGLSRPNFQKFQSQNSRNREREEAA